MGVGAALLLGQPPTGLGAQLAAVRTLQAPGAQGAVRWVVLRVHSRPRSAGRGVRICPMFEDGQDTECHRAVVNKGHL